MKQLLRIFAVVAIVVLAMLGLLYIFGLMDTPALMNYAKLTLSAIAIIAVASVAIYFVSDSRTNKEK